MGKKTKFLGVIIDENLLFKNHILYVKGKISRSLGILYKCRKYFDSDTLLMLYSSFVYPHFTYCLSVWGNTCKTYLKPPVSGVKKDHDMAILFEKYKLLPFHKIYMYFVQCFDFKFNHIVLPEIFKTFLLETQMFIKEILNQKICFTFWTPP